MLMLQKLIQADTEIRLTNYRLLKISYFDFNIVDCFPGFREPTLEGIHNNMIIYSLFYKLGESMNDFDRFGLLKIEKE